MVSLLVIFNPWTEPRIWNESHCTSLARLGDGLMEGRSERTTPQP